MTRIDTPLAASGADKPTDKTIGKVTSKEGDSRQAAFRSLLRQLGGHENADGGTSGKEPKTLSDADADAAHGMPTIRHRAASKDDKTNAALPETKAGAGGAEPTVGDEPTLAWQTILGGSLADRQEQPSATVDLTALISARAPDTDVPAALPEKTPRAASDRPGRSAGMALPSTAGLDLTHGNAAPPVASDAADPFATLSSLLEKATDTVAEPETADIAPIKMSVVARETHFEPVVRLSPVQQISTAIGEELVTVGEPVPTESASQTAEPSRHNRRPAQGIAHQARTGRPWLGRSQDAACRQVARARGGGLAPGNRRSPRQGPGHADTGVAGLRLQDRCDSHYSLDGTR